jgi:hypothetical protein
MRIALVVVTMDHFKSSIQIWKKCRHILVDQEAKNRQVGRTCLLVDTITIPSTISSLNQPFGTIHFPKETTRYHVTGGSMSITTTITHKCPPNGRTTGCLGSCLAGME